MKLADNNNNTGCSSCYELRIPILEHEAIHDNSTNITTTACMIPIPQSLMESYRNDGFVVLPNVISAEAIDALNDRLEEILRGNYSRGKAPDKTPQRLLKKGTWNTSITRTTTTTTTRLEDNKDNARGDDHHHHHHHRVPSSNNDKPMNQNDNNFSNGSSLPHHDVNRGNNNNNSNTKNNIRRCKASSASSSTSKSQSQKNTMGPLGFSGNLQNVKVLQVINVHKSDHLFHTLATSWQLGYLVAQLAGWTGGGGEVSAAGGGTRLGQDQIWAKPPGSPPLVFHRDSPYFMFEPSNVVTVWVALDDMDAELGPLEYVKGSHRWGDGRVGSANQFFQSNNHKSLLYSAAKREGILQVCENQSAGNENDDKEHDHNHDEHDTHDKNDDNHDNNHNNSNHNGGLEFVSMAGLAKGGISIHDGRTWHGSGKNESRSRPRRGLGLHFIPANAQFTPAARHSRLWRRFVTVDHADVDIEADVDVNRRLIPLSDEDFPITWSPDMTIHHVQGETDPTVK